MRFPRLRHIWFRRWLIYWSLCDFFRHLIHPVGFYKWKMEGHWWDGYNEGKRVGTEEGYRDGYNAGLIRLTDQPTVRPAKDYNYVGVGGT